MSITPPKQVTAPFGKLEVIIPGGQSLLYKADQFHFHRPTEHTLQGKSFAAEMHIVHSLESGAAGQYTKAVLGIVFDTTKDLPCKFLSALEVGKEAEIDLQTLVQDIWGQVYHYQGSLTTPPCSEIVNWFVLKTPIDASKAQVEALAAVWEKHMSGCHNNRCTCPVNGRKVYRNFEAGVPVAHEGCGCSVL